MYSKKNGNLPMPLRWADSLLYYIKQYGYAPLSAGEDNISVYYPRTSPIESLPKIISLITKTVSRVEIFCMKISPAFDRGKYIMQQILYYW